MRFFIGINANGRGMVGPQPVRRNGVISFQDFPSFRPNKTPAEVLQAGAFGGGYFRDIESSVTGETYHDAWRELPESWVSGLDVATRLSSQTYLAHVNKYGVDCGGKADKQDIFGLKAWETAGWMDPQDPYGWFMWYCRFYQGRRSDDDERQVSRWEKCAGERGRWRGNLVGKVLRDQAAFDDPTVAPVVRQTLLHWAYELTERDFEVTAKRVRKNGATYVPRSQLAHVMASSSKVKEEKPPKEETAATQKRAQPSHTSSRKKARN